MGRKKKQIPKYGTVTLNGIEYFRTRIEDADGKRVALYAKTAEELYEKVEEAKRQIEEASFRRATPTVAEYCERWLLMQSAHIRTTTLTDYSSKVKNYIVAPLGHMYMANVTTDDVRLALVAASEKSNSVYRSVHMLYKAIFNSAVVFIIYKPIITAMRNAGFIVSEVKREASANRRPNYSVMIIAAIVGIVALLFFFLKLNGSFTFG